MANIYSYRNYKLNKTTKPRYLKHGGIIAGGVAHAEKNNIGDMGIPVVPFDSYQKHGKYIKEHKEVEVESEEIVFNEETSIQLDTLVDEYLECGCRGKLFLIGQIIYEATKNLVDETCRTECKFEPKLNKIR